MSSLSKQKQQTEKITKKYMAEMTSVLIPREPFIKTGLISLLYIVSHTDQGIGFPGWLSVAQISAPPPV